MTLSQEFGFTHTGEVTGKKGLILDKTSISNKTLVTAVAGDHVLVGDATDSDELKKVDVTDFLGGGGGNLKHIGTYSVSAGTSLAFDLPSGYKGFKVKAVFTATTGGISIACRMGATTVDTGGTDYSHYYSYFGSSSSSAYNAGNDRMNLCYPIANAGGILDLEISALYSDAGQITVVTAEGSNQTHRSAGGGSHKNTEVVDKFEFVLGDIDSITDFSMSVELYGYTN